MFTIADLSKYNKIVINDISLNGDLSSNIVGKTGPTGEKGETGSSGYNGVIGITGPTGPSADSIWSTSINGNDIYFNNEENNSIKKVFITDNYSNALAMGDSYFRVYNNSTTYTNFNIGDRNMFIQARPDQSNTGYTPYIGYYVSSGNPQIYFVTAYNNFNHWLIEYPGSNYLDFKHLGSAKGYVRRGGGNPQMNFTGQHTTFINDVHTNNISLHRGLIVCANNDTYISISSNTPDHGNSAITINESLPLLSLAKKEKDKTVFGVISDCEDSARDGYRSYDIGAFGTCLEKEYGDQRIHVNSVGEGAIWVSNKNGSLVSGEYITSSNIPGYGQKQDSEFVYNYTVAKITMNCDFQPKLQYKKKIITRNVEFTSMDSSGNYYDVSGNIFIYSKNSLQNEGPNEQINNDYNVVLDNSKNLVNVNQNVLDDNNEIQWEDTEEQEFQYDLRYIDMNGNIITKEKYEESKLNNENVYIAAFVGCSYHCG